MYSLDVLLSQFGTSSMSRCNCCFLNCIQFSQEAGQVVWYSHLLQNFPQFVVIHTVKVFGIVSEAEVDVFLEFSCFFDGPADVGNLISGSSAFCKFSFDIWSSWFMYRWSLAWRILSITLLSCERKWKWSRSVVSDPQWPHELQPSRLLCPWDFPGKSTGVGCHCLLLVNNRPYKFKIAVMTQTMRKENTK